MSRPLKYPAETMTAAIAACRSGELSSVVARRFSLPQTTLRHWRKKVGLMRQFGRHKFDWDTACRQRREGEKLIYLGALHGVTVTAIAYAMKHQATA